ncbi:hypothetical protein T484DRAFT_1860672 [Baffinella frigidus]|nr:hypothetical protein T484DRAFT_1860672 [Cryptophyta sp. CCMP2293]
MGSSCSTGAAVHVRQNTEQVSAASQRADVALTDKRPSLKSTDSPLLSVRARRSPVMSRVSYSNAPVNSSIRDARPVQMLRGGPNPLAGIMHNGDTYDRLRPSASDLFMRTASDGRPCTPASDGRPRTAENDLRSRPPAFRLLVPAMDVGQVLKLGELPDPTPEVRRDSTVAFSRAASAEASVGRDRPPTGLSRATTEEGSASAGARRLPDGGHAASDGGAWRPFVPRDGVNRLSSCPAPSYQVLALSDSG